MSTMVFTASLTDCLEFTVLTTGTEGAPSWWIHKVLAVPNVQPILGLQPKGNIYEILQVLAEVSMMIQPDLNMGLAQCHRQFAEKFKLGQVVSPARVFENYP